MNSFASWALAIKDRVLPEFGVYGANVREIWLLGSRITDLARPDSDFDLYVFVDLDLFQGEFHGELLGRNVELRLVSERTFSDRINTGSFRELNSVRQVCALGRDALWKRFQPLIERRCRDESSQLIRDMRGEVGSDGLALIQIAAAETQSIALDHVRNERILAAITRAGEFLIDLQAYSEAVLSNAPPEAVPNADWITVSQSHRPGRFLDIRRLPKDAWIRTSADRLNDLIATTPRSIIAWEGFFSKLDTDFMLRFGSHLILKNQSPSARIGGYRHA